jgi:hypothetical protein
MPDALPSLPRLAVRLMIAGVAVLWLSHTFQKVIVQPLLPIWGYVLAVSDSEVKVLSAAGGHEGPNETVSFHVNLAHPIDIAGRTAYPYGTHSIPDGFMEVNLGAAGLLQYALLLLILVLAWPLSGAVELFARLLISVPLLAALLVIPGPSTALSLVWGPFHEALDPNTFWPILAWSRFLSGGGGVAIALIMAAAAIGLAQKARHRTATISRYAAALTPAENQKKRS